VKQFTIIFLAFLFGASVMAAEVVFDVRFDQLQGDKLPSGWNYYGTGSRVQLQDGNLVFTNEDQKRESGIVTRFEVKKGFDYEFTVELVEGIPGEKVQGVFLLLSTADGQTREYLAQAPVVSGSLGQYVSSSMHYLALNDSQVSFYLHSRRGYTPRAKIRRVSCQRSSERRTWLPANQPPFTVCGLPFMKENNGAYYRYPEARAKHLATWNASSQPSGARIRFKTNADRIDLLINHGKTSSSPVLMSVLSTAGMDIYQGPPDHMVFAWRPNPSLIKNGAPYIVTYNPKGNPGEMRDYTIYLPMYARLESLHISLSPASAKIEPPTPYKLDKPVVWYSTSFAQGAGSSGPSMSFPALTCRLLGVDLVNYGIGGNREWKPEEAELLSEIPAAVYVMGPILGDVAKMQERYPKMVEILRRRHPNTPILLVTRLHTIGVTQPHEVNALVRKLYEERRVAGDKHIHFLDAFNLYSDGTIPYTIDGVHVTDLGAKTIADAFVPVLRRILNFQ